MSDADKYTLTEKDRVKIIKEIESYQVELEVVSSFCGPSWIPGNDIISMKNKQKILTDKLAELNQILSSGVLSKDYICKIEQKEEQLNNNERVSIEIKDENNKTIALPSWLQSKTEIISKPIRLMSKPQNVFFNEVKPSWLR